jgi:hypothetical protein
MRFSRDYEGLRHEVKMFILLPSSYSFRKKNFFHDNFINLQLEAECPFYGIFMTYDT